MKKIILSMLAVLALSWGAMAENGESYTIDDAAIEQVFAAAADATMSQAYIAGLVDLSAPMQGAATATLSQANPIGAWLICWFLGGFGIHRHYMGTDRLMFLYYIITCGGIFGIVPLVDWVVLLIGVIDNDISKYVNNSRFFMWA
ncbi:MAG: TM2 domain-containing protein [Bacteroidales bacterium]|nr:TM2 domain-containing protein [Bacteroidales bacterium]